MRYIKPSIRWWTPCPTAPGWSMGGHSPPPFRRCGSSIQSDTGEYQRSVRASGGAGTQAGHGQQSFGRLPATFLFLYAGRPHQQNRSHCPNIASTVFMPSVIAYPHFHDLDSYREELKHYSEAEVIFQARVTFAIPNEGWHIRECSDFSTFYDYIAHFPATDEERYQILGAVRNFPQLCRRADGAAAAHSGLHSGKCLPL